MKSNYKESPSQIITFGTDLRLHTLVSRRCLLVILLCMLLTAFMVTPVLAGTKYMSGSSNLTVRIAGNNEFSPGTTVPLQIQVQNTGLNEIKFVQSGIIERDDNPNTAKMVTVSLLAGDSPALIKSDPQMIGDIRGSQSVPASFVVLVPDDAKAGKYSLQVVLNYTNMNNAEQEGTDTITYRYVKREVTFNLPFIVRSAINLQVDDIKTENLSAGGSGFITLTLKNIGTDTGESAVATLNQSGNSLIIPVSSSVYIGTFAPNTTKIVKYKVSVSKEAESQDYPIDIAIIYENKDDETLVTPFQKIGIPVQSDVDFTIISEAPELYPGKKQFISVTYRNDGSVPVYSAEVRISAIDPFTSADDLSYLGDLKPGESRVARFGLTVDASADTKVYGLDSEVKYRDALDDTHISDTIKVPINVVLTQGISSLVLNPIVIGIIIVFILGVGYYIFEFHRKTKNSVRIKRR